MARNYFCRYAARMATTLLLDRDVWDLVADAAGNIALASEPYAILQDVASACRLFLGEQYYDTTRGVPFFREALGQFRPSSVLKARLVEAALGVPGVLAAQSFLTNAPGRGITGQIQVTTADGTFTVTL